MRIGRKKIDDDGWRFTGNRNKAVSKENRYGTSANEKYYAVGSGGIPCRDRREHNDDF